MRNVRIVIVLSLLVVGSMNSQTNEVLDNLSLDDVLNLDISVAAKRSSTLREAPGIVSLITQEDIVNSGAVDLIDVLRLVPGIDFNQDTPDFLGISMRGNWANEGKVLVMLDGMPLNDLLFGCTPFGNRVQLSTIDKIEIIRGPGSAQYGGMAMLGVINIITKKANQISGVRAEINEGRISNVSGLSNYSISSGFKLSDADITISAYTSSAVRSVGLRPYHDMSEISMNDYSSLSLKGINIGVNSKTTALRFIYDDYSFGSLDMVIPETFLQKFNTLFTEMKHTINLSTDLFITPSISVIRQIPWQLDVEAAKAADVYFNRCIQRTTASLLTSYDPTASINIIAGAEYYNDNATTPEETRDISFFGTDTNNKKTHLEFNTFSFYGQMLINSDIANITIGARYENNTSFYGAFTPRIAVTKMIGNFHAKALYSRAYRSPLVEYLSGNPLIVPEMSSNAELELGYQFTPQVFARCNLFTISIEKPIVYDFDGLMGTYYNGTHTGSHGLEGEINYKTPNFSCVASYSTYRRSSDDIETYINPIDDSRHIGMADYKLTINASIRLSETIWLNANQVFFGERDGFIYDNETEGSKLKCFEPVSLVNASLRFDDILSTGFDVRLNVHNLFNVANSFVGGYSSPSAQVYPINDLPRMVQFQLQYNLKTN